MSMKDLHNEYLGRISEAALWEQAKQCTVRMPQEVHDRCARIAEHTGQSVNSVMADVISEGSYELAHLLSQDLDGEKAKEQAHWYLCHGYNQPPKFEGEGEAA